MRNLQRNQILNLFGGSALTNKEKIEAAEKRIIELKTLIKHWQNEPAKK